MAHFIGRTKGQRSATSRLGSKQSGIVSEANGWSIGGTVSVVWNDTEKRNEVHAEITHGSNGGGYSLNLGVYYLDDGEIMRK